MAAELSEEEIKAFDAKYGPGTGAAWNEGVARARAGQKRRTAQDNARFRQELMGPPAPGNQRQSIFDMPMPSNQAIGIMRGKDESDASVATRESTMRPKGARSGAGGGLDELRLMQAGLGSKEARAKAQVIRSQGGEVYIDDLGVPRMRAAYSRPTATGAARSSTGADYDPAASRRNMMADAEMALAERRNLQASDEAIARKRQELIQKPGARTGMAGRFGMGQSQGNTAAEFARRKPAMLTEGSQTEPMADAIARMKKQQSMPAPKKA